jgi:hypothetical protein
MRVAVFTVRFDGPLYLNGTPITELPNTAAQTGGDSMPDSVVLQMSTSYLSCECQNCTAAQPFDQFCDATRCLYTSNMDDAVGDGAPSVCIPLPAVTEPVFALFSVFAGIQDDDALVAEENTYRIAKIISSQNEMRQWVDMIPDNLDYTKCKLHFTGLETENGTSLNGTVTPYFSADAQSCNYTGFVEENADLQESIEGTEAMEDKDSMQSFTWKLAAYASRRNLVLCQDLALSFLVEGTFNKTIRGDKGCHEEFKSEEWYADPCCNHDLRFEQCCLPKTTVVEVLGYAEVNQDAVEESCNNPEKAAIVLRQLVAALDSSDKCEDQIKSRGFDFEIWDSMMSFVEDCREDVFGTNGVAPTCMTDTDCYTRCDTTTETCVVPWDNPEPALVECFIENMNQDLDRYLRRKFNLTSWSSADEFSEAFESNMQDLNCVGPMSYDGQERWEQQEVESCDDGDHDCWCMGNGNETQCVRNVHILANQTACLAQESCNWNMQATNESQCLENTNNPGTTHFCGDCHGVNCWEVTQPAMCYKWVMNTGECDALNGRRGPWGDNMCVLNITTEEDCTPDDKCPSSNGNWDRWCDTFCYLPDANQTQCQQAGVPSWFDTNVASGSGICRVWVANCSGDYSLHTGYTWRAGQFDTEEKCDLGMCDINPNLNSSQCSSQGACTLPCHRCRPRTHGANLCASTASNQTHCDSLKGQWKNDNVTCVLPDVRTRVACENLGFTLYTCESMDDDRDACLACENEEDGCPIDHTLLSCYSNPWDQCENETKCEQNGICNDW